MANLYNIPNGFVLRTPGVVPNLHKLPDELILKIATHINDEPSWRGHHRDLSAFARVARGCQHAAQEVLFRAPVVQKPAILPFFSCDQNKQVLLQHNKLMHLLRSLVEVPSLARRVRGLGLCCLYSHWQNSGASPLPWIGGDSPATEQERWVSHFLEKGPSDIVAARFQAGSSRINQFAMAGFILRLCPNLEVLHIEAYRVLHHRHELTGLLKSCYELEAQPFSVQNMLSAMYHHHRGKVTRIGNLANLTTLSLNGPLPPILKHLTSLKYLELSITPGSRKNRDYACFTSILAQAGDPAVTHLVINADVEFLRLTSIMEQPLHWEHITHLRSMPHLKRLDISFFRDAQSHLGLVLGNDYDNILGWIPSPTIEEFVVDTADVDTASGWWIRLELLGLLESLADHLPNLRRIVVPQEILVGVHLSGVDYCALPDTLEVIEVIDCTQALNTWAKYIVREHQQNRLPHLKRIVF